jgi:2-keto-3-deoxy-L-fuconate dehydrogenase
MNGVGSRIVVVTGSSGGIGSVIVDRFSALGDTVVGLDIADGFDITNRASCAAAVAEIEADHGAVDVLCNNAGIGAVGDVVDATDEQWQSVFDVNVFGIARLSAAVIPGMRRRGGGAIVNTCSVAAEVGLVERAVYSASKGAVRALTMAMAADESDTGIRVNCVSPGTVDGPWVRRLIDNSPDPDATLAALEARQPLGGLVSAESVADAIIYLAAPTTFTSGIELRLDGGITSLRIVR